MSKKWIYILVSLGLLQSCADRAYRGDADMQMAINEPMPVMIVVGDPQNLLSKGSGAIDSDTDSWGGAPIYVYSFRKDLYTAFSSLGSDQNGECLVDASVEDPGNLAGKPARVSELDAYATWTGPVKTIYYPANIQPYDFYAYYIDDMQIPSESISRTQTSISFPVEIDGSQDLMSAKAALTVFFFWFAISFLMRQKYNAAPYPASVPADSLPTARIVEKFVLSLFTIL